MNRNVLKIIALISMLIDHIGMVFFPSVVIFKIIGRISMPIFAFFIAEGYFYTRSKCKYAITMAIFMVISWVPFNLAFGFPMYKANILGVFLLSIFGMTIIDKIKKNDNYKLAYIALFVLYMLICFILDGMGVIPEGILGVMLPIVFYAFRENRVLKYTFAGVILVLLSILVLLNNTGIFRFYQFFALLSLIFIALYNGQKGKLNLKYLFYLFYPIHLILLWAINVII